MKLDQAGIHLVTSARKSLVSTQRIAGRYGEPSYRQVLTYGLAKLQLALVQGATSDTGDPASHNHLQKR
jgi:hypothetical protein